MRGPAIHESESEELSLTGRRMRWVVSPETLQSNNRCSACIIRVPPREKVRPAHSHPNGEEVIHIISGSGRVLVSGEVYQTRVQSQVFHGPLLPPPSARLTGPVTPEEAAEVLEAIGQVWM